MASQFQHFPLLPIELQTQIWKFTLPPPHVIRLQISTFPTTNLALMTRGISYDEERSGRRSAGLYFSSPCCLPVLLHISHHTRQLALAIYRQSFTSGEMEKQGLGLWYQAVNAFREEWEADAFWEDWESGEGGDERRQFFEKEKEVFDEARMFLARRAEMEASMVELRVKSGYNKLENKSPMYKGKWLTRAKGIFEDGKRFARRVKGGQGVWYRPGCDVLFLGKAETRALAELVVMLTEEWALQDVKSLAVEEFWEASDPGKREEICRVLFGRRSHRVGYRKQNHPDSDSDEMEDMPPAMFLSLNELTIVVSDGYHHYRDLNQPMIRIKYPKERVDQLKEQYRLRTLRNLWENSSFAKMPTVKVVRDDELFSGMRKPRRPWNRAMWDGCAMGHREDCHRYGMERPAQSVRNAGGDARVVVFPVRYPARPPPPPPPPSQHYYPLPPPPPPPGWPNPRPNLSPSQNSPPPRPLLPSASSPPHN